MTDTATTDTAGSLPGASIWAGILTCESFLCGAEALDMKPSPDHNGAWDGAAEEHRTTARPDQALPNRLSARDDSPGMSAIADAAVKAVAERDTALRQRVLSLRAGVSRMLADPAQLPPAPLVYQNLSRLIDDPKSSPNQVSEVVSSDPASTSRLLQVVNSPFFGLRKRVDTVSAAVRLLGFEPVRSLVLAITAGDMFKAPPGVAAGAVEQLWRHSIGVGVAAKVIGRRMGAPDVEQCFIAGLLHDIGKIVLLRSAPEAFQATLDLAAQEQVLFLDAEATVCGTDHAAIGLMLAEKWAFPPSLAEAVSLHHRPELAKANPELVAAVHVADIVCRALAIGSGGDALLPVLNRVAKQTLGLDAANLKEIVEAVELEYPDVETSLLGGVQRLAA